MTKDVIFPTMLHKLKILQLLWFDEVQRSTFSRKYNLAFKHSDQFDLSRSNRGLSESIWVVKCLCLSDRLIKFEQL